MTDVSALPFLINFTCIYNTSVWEEFEIELGIFLQELPVMLEKIIPLTHKEKSELSIVFSNDDEVRNLNKAYRHIDAYTNVLSFTDVFPDELAYLKPNQDPHLGDVILAYETIQREAVQQEKTFLEHTKHLILHGVLHVIGYDHMTPQDAEQMEPLEIKVLNAFNIKNPYE